MKNTINLFTVLLVLWIAGCSWYYVCKIRSHCNAVNTEINQVPSQPAVLVSDSLPALSSKPSPPPPDYSIMFNSGTNICELTNEDRNFFARLQGYANENPEILIRVTGFADNTGTSSLNLKISTDRAAFIKNQLLNSGIPAEIIEEEGRGELDPVADNATVEGRAQNRRVEIKTNKNQ